MSNIITTLKSSSKQHPGTMIEDKSKVDAENTSDNPESKLEKAYQFLDGVREGVQEGMSNFADKFISKLDQDPKQTGKEFAQAVIPAVGLEYKSKVGVKLSSKLEKDGIRPEQVDDKTLLQIQSEILSGDNSRAEILHQAIQAEHRHFLNVMVPEFTDRPFDYVANGDDVTDILNASTDAQRVSATALAYQHLAKQTKILEYIVANNSDDASTKLRTKQLLKDHAETLVEVLKLETNNLHSEKTQNPKGPDQQETTAKAREKAIKYIDKSSQLMSKLGKILHADPHSIERSVALYKNGSEALIHINALITGAGKNSLSLDAVADAALGAGSGSMVNPWLGLGVAMFGIASAILSGDESDEGLSEYEALKIHITTLIEGLSKQIERVEKNIIAEIKQSRRENYEAECRVMTSLAELSRSQCDMEAEIRRLSQQLRGDIELLQNNVGSAELRASDRHYDLKRDIGYLSAAPIDQAIVHLRPDLDEGVTPELLVESIRTFYEHTMHTASQPLLTGSGVSATNMQAISEALTPREMYYNNTVFALPGFQNIALLQTLAQARGQSVSSLECPVNPLKWQQCAIEICNIIRLAQDQGTHFANEQLRTKTYKMMQEIAHIGEELKRIMQALGSVDLLQQNATAYINNLNALELELRMLYHQGDARLRETVRSRVESVAKQDMAFAKNMPRVEFKQLREHLEHARSVLHREYGSWDSFYVGVTHCGGSYNAGPARILRGCEGWMTMEIDSYRDQRVDRYIPEVEEFRNFQGRSNDVLIAERQESWEAQRQILIDHIEAAQNDLDAAIAPNSTAVAELIKKPLTQVLFPSNKISTKFKMQTVLQLPATGFDLEPVYGLADALGVAKITFEYDINPEHPNVLLVSARAKLENGPIETVKQWLLPHSEPICTDETLFGFWEGGRDARQEDKFEFLDNGKCSRAIFHTARWPNHEPYVGVRELLASGGATNVSVVSTNTILFEKVSSQTQERLIQYKVDAMRAIGRRINAKSGENLDTLINTHNALYAVMLNNAAVAYGNQFAQLTSTQQFFSNNALNLIKDAASLSHFAVHDDTGEFFPFDQLRAQVSALVDTWQNNTHDECFFAPLLQQLSECIEFIHSAPVAPVGVEETSASVGAMIVQAVQSLTLQLQQIQEQNAALHREVAQRDVRIDQMATQITEMGARTVEMMDILRTLIASQPPPRN